MSAGTANRSADAGPHGPATSAEAGEPAAAAPARAKSRNRRPRPCFDDGSPTRVFKFPSKAYPRSTYYVTGTEIIIRIKKGRKKWKLVVPKKRLVATNRWFTKPRWVEIELTFTQAVKLGLIAPRAPEAVGADGSAAEQAGAGESALQVVDRESGQDGEQAGPLLEAPAGDEPNQFDADDEADEAGQVSLSDDTDSEGDEDTSDEGMGDSGTGEEDASHQSCDVAPAFGSKQHPTNLDLATSQVVDGGNIESETNAGCSEERDPTPVVNDNAVSDHPAIIAGHEPTFSEPDCPAQPELGANGGNQDFANSALEADEHLEVEPKSPDCHTPEPAHVPLGPAVVPSIQSTQPPGVASRRWANAMLAMAASLLVLTTSVSVGPLLEAPMPGTFAIEDGCPQAGEAAACGAPIITGSIAEAEPAASVPLVPASDPEPEPVRELQPALVAEVVAIPVEAAPAEAAAEPVAPATAAEEPAAEPTVIAPEPVPAIDADLARMPPEPPVEKRQCREELAVAARSISIRFNKASSDLDRPTAGLLDLMAVELRSCPRIRVTIEGHTDSDGTAARNEALSMRRAEAVRRQLVEAGARPEQVRAVGLGQSRPYEPNVSPENKRRNRRAALVVEEIP